MEFAGTKALDRRGLTARTMLVSKIIEKKKTLRTSTFFLRSFLHHCKIYDYFIDFESSKIFHCNRSWTLGNRAFLVIYRPLSPPSPWPPHPLPWRPLMRAGMDIIRSAATHFDDFKRVLLFWIQWCQAIFKGFKHKHTQYWSHTFQNMRFGYNLLQHWGNPIVKV